jgi:hypothetical protein
VIKKLIVIEPEDAQRYRTSLAAVCKRLTIAFLNSDDMSYRKWINHHGPILDELMDELKQR